VFGDILELWYTKESGAQKAALFCALISKGEIMGHYDEKIKDLERQFETVNSLYRVAHGQEKNRTEVIGGQYVTSRAQPRDEASIRRYGDELSKIREEINRYKELKREEEEKAKNTVKTKSKTKGSSKVGNAVKGVLLAGAITVGTVLGANAIEGNPKEQVQEDPKKTELSSGPTQNAEVQRTAAQDFAFNNRQIRWDEDRALMQKFPDEIREINVPMNKFIFNVIDEVYGPDTAMRFWSEEHREMYNVIDKERQTRYAELREQLKPEDFTADVRARKEERQERNRNLMNITDIENERS